MTYYVHQCSIKEELHSDEEDSANEFETEQIKGDAQKMRLAQNLDNSQDEIAIFTPTLQAYWIKSLKNTEKCWVMLSKTSNAK